MSVRRRADIGCLACIILLSLTQLFTHPKSSSSSSSSQKYENICTRVRENVTSSIRLRSSTKQHQILTNFYTNNTTSIVASQQPNFNSCRGFSEVTQRREVFSIRLDDLTNMTLWLFNCVLSNCTSVQISNTLNIRGFSIQRNERKERMERKERNGTDVRSVRNVRNVRNLRIASSNQ